MSNGINPILQAKADIHRVFSRLADNKEVEINGGSKNTAPIATRFLIAEQGRSFWNKHYDNVKKEAKEAGILGGEEDYVEGETRVVASFTGFDITAKKSAASEMVDRKALENALNKHVTGPKRDLILSECIKERKGAVTIAVSIR